MKFVAVLQQFDSDLWGHHFMVPQEIATRLVESHGKRVICTINDTLSYQCALMPMCGGEYFININKINRSKLGIDIGSLLQIELQPDTSKYGLPMSEEFEEVLRQDEVGSAYFHALTPGKQRTLIHYAGNVKSSAIKVRRSMVVMEHLVMHEGVIDFKALNEEMKEANRREKRI